MKLTSIELEALVKYTLRKTNVKNLMLNGILIFKQATRYANELKLRSIDLLRVTIASSSNYKIFLTFNKDILENHILSQRN
ncbi:MAG: hypothetical protein B6U89_03700 [Desulfurococcales archaeon ex4484_58]|nr:MAG: hypothetical protein B6U89_03700 [Desulfurococcales archaeon ex4484_58]